MRLVMVLAEKVRNDFDSGKDCDNDGIMVKHSSMWKFEEEIAGLSDIIVPYLEKNRYSCYLYVDKVYIYRTLPLTEEQRVSSYQWHYDNNPNEIVKTLIYLNDVTEVNSPYEYLVSPLGQGVLGRATRRGTVNWKPAPNNSRVGHLIPELKEMGYSPKRVTGSAGTAVSFINNSIHRANPVLEGYRDVINIRVKPTFEPAPTYVSPKWTTGFETSGVVNRDPEPAWTIKN
jgi:plastocyanin